VAGIRLRRTSEDDVGLLTAWLSSPEVYRGMGGAPVPREVVLAKYTGRRAPDVECFLALAGDTPVAFVQYVDEGDERAMDMFVAPDHQRKGFGRAAVDAVVTDAWSAGKHLLSVDPSASNESALDFWRAVGFQDAGPLTGNALRMVLRVSTP